jgi:hypothetical protein
MSDEVALQRIPPAAAVPILAVMAEAGETAASARRAFLRGLSPAVTTRHGVRRPESMLECAQAEVADQFSEVSCWHNNLPGFGAGKSAAQPLRSALHVLWRASFIEEPTMPDDDMTNHPAALHPPTLLDEASWAVCPHIQRWASPALKECLRCPALERDPEAGLSKRLCRINAEKAAIAVLNVANRWWATTGPTSKCKVKA